MKSGTTICGIQLKDVVILAADTRSTSGPMVADKSLAFFKIGFPFTRNRHPGLVQVFVLAHLRNCEKLHFIAKNVYCAGAGTAADLQHLALQTNNIINIYIYIYNYIYIIIYIYNYIYIYLLYIYIYTRPHEYIIRKVENTTYNYRIND